MNTFLKALTTAGLALSASPLFGCGVDTNCTLGERHYRIAMPDAHDGVTPVGAIVFSHGYRGSAAGLMRNKGLRKAISDMGLAFIALKSKDDDWVLPNSPRRENVDGSEEFNYVDAVIADASAKFSIDTDRMMASGFSAGGMMTWNLACARSDTFAAFAPISGTFWLKPQDNCAKPVASIIHIHGDNDPTVPLTGRVIADTKQGDVDEALEMYKAFGGFKQTTPTRTDMFTCENSANASGDILAKCMFSGGHSFRSAYLKYAWETFEAAGRL